MKSTEYREQVYRLGIPIRVREIETEVQAYQRDYPEFFLSPTPVQLLRPESRNGGWGGPRPGAGHPPGTHTANQIAQRTRTKELLDWFAAKPRTVTDVHAKGADMRAIYQLTHNSYLLRKGNIITRTKKPFHIEKAALDREKRRMAAMAQPAKKKKPSPQGASAIRAQRERSAAYLAKFDTDEPRHFPSLTMGSLVRRGYLKPKGDGYVRTAKEFSVEKH